MIRTLRRLGQTRASRTTAIAFALNSTIFGNWFARIPAVQAELGLSDGGLGLALLGLPLGSVLTLPVAGWLVAKHGAGRVTWWATLGLCLAVPLPALAGGAVGLALALAVLGVFNAAQDVAMNVGAAAIESRAGISMMSSFHAMFSLGGIAGAGLGALAAGLGVAPPWHLAAVGLAAALLTLSRRGTLAAEAEPRRESAATGEAAPLFALPRGPLVGLALVCFATLLAEGAAADWSAVHLLNNLGAGPTLAALGYAFFAVGMTAGRLAGDALRDRLGELRVVRDGALLGAAGLAAGLLVAHPLAAALGFLCLGLGLAGIVPIVFRRAALAPGFAPGVGLAAVAGLGYAGFVAGPPVIGLIAEFTGLGLALCVVPALALAVAAGAGPALRAAEGAAPAPPPPAAEGRPA